VESREATRGAVRVVVKARGSRQRDLQQERESRKVVVEKEDDDEGVDDV